MTRFKMGDTIVLTEADVSTPPLDPSKVKAGDTVTAKGKHGTVVDVEVKRFHAEWTRTDEGEPIRALEVLDGMLILFLDGPDAWTLTAHQPAPEPEPEWKPGTRGTGTVNGRKVGGFISEFNSAIGFYYWNEFAGHTSYTSMIPEDFTPDVVIDPDSASNALILSGFDARQRRAILSALGLDGAS